MNTTNYHFDSPSYRTIEHGSLNETNSIYETRLPAATSALQYLDQASTYFKSLFLGAVNSWNAYLEYLSVKQDMEDTVVVPYTQYNVANASIFTELRIPHQDIKAFDESNFTYNLNGKKPKYTNNEKANYWIDAFATFNIDIGRLIQKEHVLPDHDFVRKRFILAQKMTHPDRNMNNFDVREANKRSQDLNVAKDELDDLYSNAESQVTLFHAVLNTLFLDAYDHPESVLVSPSSTISPQFNNAPFIVLYLGGALVGTCLVLYGVRNSSMQVAKKRKY